MSRSNPDYLANFIAWGGETSRYPAFSLFDRALAVRNISSLHRELPSPLSASEATLYYHGLPSSPLLVARTNTTPWAPPTGPVETWKPKKFLPVGNHPINQAWEDDLARKVFGLLDSMKVERTSVDIVRIGYAGGYFPIVLWIGVVPASLNGYDGIEVASKCLELLKENGIDNVEVEIYESVVRRRR